MKVLFNQNSRDVASHRGCPLATGDGDYQQSNRDRFIVRPIILAIALMALAFYSPTRSMAGLVGAEVVLAVDVSGSVDDAEFALQKQGYVDAFYDSSVIDAILTNPAGSVAVSLVYWSSGSQQLKAVDWTLINSAATANAFGALINATTRPYSNSTSISGALNFSTPLFDNNGFESSRLIIDVSGDGTNNSDPEGVNLASARQAALDAGIIVNGLPILQGGDSLLAYYENNVIGGLGSFVVPAQSFNVFGESFEQKLIREVNPDYGAVPEPGTYISVGLGLVLLSLTARRKTVEKGKVKAYSDRIST